MLWAPFSLLRWSLKERGQHFSRAQSPGKCECSQVGITSLWGGDKGIRSRWEAVLSLELSAMCYWF